jgi:hypothetical protein
MQHQKIKKSKNKKRLIFALCEKLFFDNDFIVND